MPKITKQKKSPYSKEQMFCLVENFSEYPDFLPFCKKASSKKISDNEIEGTLFIDKGHFKKSFTTRNKIFTPNKIELNLVDGPFKYLYGSWFFFEEDFGSTIRLDLNYELNLGLLSFVMNGAFEVITQSMIDSFCKEARRRYG